MRTIYKRKEPGVLVEARLSGATFGALDATTKRELREQLVEEQRGLCCYCMAQIRPDTCRIEHFRPQSSFPTEGLAYRNLLAACHGNEGAGPASHHCDVRKGSRSIQFDPRHPSTHADSIRYGANGAIVVTDEVHQRELDDVLGLNLPLLQSNRKRAVEVVVRELTNRKWDLSRVRKQLARYDDPSSRELPPYAGAVAQKLRSYLQKHAIGP